MSEQDSLITEDNMHDIVHALANAIRSIGRLENTIVELKSDVDTMAGEIVKLTFKVDDLEKELAIVRGYV